MTNVGNNVTEFGKMLRQIRKYKGDSLRNLAEKLGVSAAFLSAMEIGKKKIPTEYADRICEIDSLSDEQKQNLEDSISISNNRLLLDLNGLNRQQKEASLTFARKIKSADPDLIEKLMKALDENED